MSLRGQTNAERIWNFLSDKLKNNYGVAGLMGNLYAESGLVPTNLQNSYNKSLGMTDDEYTTSVDNGDYTNFVKDKAGYGLAQWTYWSRKQSLINYAHAKNKSIGNLEMQLNFLWEELQGYTGVLNVLKNATSLKEASDIVLLQFEKPADQSDTIKNKRALFGEQYYNTYVSTKKYYRVQCGAFSKKSNAEKLQAKLKADKFDTLLKFVAPYYKVQCGAFVKESNAEELLRKLKAKGYDAFITQE